MLRRILWAVLAAVLFAPLTASAASAETPIGCPKGYSPQRGICTIVVRDPAKPDPVTADPVRNGPTTCTSGATPIPCSTADGTWNGHCYVKAADPQPDKSNPVWEGNTDGYIVACTDVHAAGQLGPFTGEYWAPALPGTVSPRLVAQSAVAQMGFQAGQIGLAPPVRADSMGIVGKPVWMWIADPGESTTGPITRTATAGAITVTATAVLSKVVWSMGDGKQVTCEGAKAPGTAWASSYGWSPSPTCGYVYEKSSADQKGLAYTLTATSYWTVTWSSNDGASGTIPLQFDRSIAEPVGEVQAVVTHD